MTQQSITLRAFERRTLAEQVADQLVETITTTYHAGRRLPSVRELATQFRVSPNTANAALRLLDQRKLIRVIPRQGAFVAQMNSDNGGVTWHVPGGAMLKR